MSLSVNEHSDYFETMPFEIFQPQPLHIKSCVHDNADRSSAEARKETVQTAGANRKRLTFHNIVLSFNSSQVFLKQILTQNPLIISNNDIRTAAETRLQPQRRLKKREKGHQRVISFIQIFN